MNLPLDWRRALGPELEPVWGELTRFVAEERASARVLPPDSRVTAAFEATPFEAVRVVLLGQDPYPAAGQACGLSFSVLPGVPVPASLANLFRERESDLGLPVPTHGWLGAWAERGMLLCNTVLTVRCGEPASHTARGWERFTDLVLDALNARGSPCVFVLLGGPARKKRSRITNDRHRVFEGVHPSPLSANTGFFGSRLFSSIDRLLSEVGAPPFDWSLPAEPGVVEVARDRDPSLDALAGYPPRPGAILKLLDLPVWRELTVAEAAEVAGALEPVLPAPFALQGVEPGPCGPRVWFERGGSRFVLVPGATVDLGFKGVKAKLSVPRRREVEAKLGTTVERWFADHSTPVRTATLAPFLAAEHASPVAEWLPVVPPGPDAVASTDAALRASGLALPSLDQAEYLHSAGERGWFPWGMEWPADRSAPSATPFGTVFEPDPDRPEWTSDPFRWTGGGVPGAPSDLLWASALEGNSGSHPSLPRPPRSRARIRPIRPIFPYWVR